MPLYLRGTEAADHHGGGGPTWGAGDADSVEMRQVVRGVSSQPTGLGPLGDELAQVARESLDRGKLFQPIYPAALPAPGIARTSCWPPAS